MKAVRPSLSTDEVLWLYTGPGAPSVSDLPAKEAYEVAFCLMGKAVASSNPRMLEEPLRHLQRLDSAARTALPWQPPNSAIAPLAIPVHVNICMQVQRPRWGTHLLSLVCVCGDRLVLIQWTCWEPVVCLLQLLIRQSARLSASRLAALACSACLVELRHSFSVDARQ